MRIELAGSAKGRNKSVGTEMIAPLWPETLPNSKVQPRKEGREEQKTEAESNPCRPKE